MKELSQELKDVIKNRAKNMPHANSKAAYELGAAIALTTPSIYEKAGLSSVEWIPVSEEPEKRIRFNTWDGLIVSDCYLDGDNIWKYTQTDQPVKYPITHYKPLPSPPKQ